MSVADLPAEQLVTLALEAIGERAPERLRPLLDAEIVVETERGRHHGIEAALAWARKGYDHLDRRYRLIALEPHGEDLLGSGRVEYVWRDSGEVGDSSPIFLGFRISEGLLTRIVVHEDRDAVRRALDAGS